MKAHPRVSNEDVSAPNALIRKLGSVEPFTDDDRAVLAQLSGNTRLFEARRDIIRTGDAPANVHLVLNGFAYRYKLLADGERQIVAVLVPGDFCDLHVAILGEMDHAIATLTACTVAEIPATAIRDVTQNHPHIIRALWWATLVDEGTLREWLMSLGQRDAIQRMAHFFCEMLMRLDLVGLVDDNSYSLPLTQIDLADILGLTSVHVNRTLQELRGSGLISFQGKRVGVLDVDRLKEFCDFDPIYLHLAARRPPVAV